MFDLDAIRRPAYTGVNRCWPCTAINLAFVAIAAVVAGVVFPVLAPVVLLAGVAAVYLRGYVVPGTPRFAPRLVAALPVAFGPKGTGAGSESRAGPGLGGVDGTGGTGSGDTADTGDTDDTGDVDGPPADSVDPEHLLAALVDAGVLAEVGGDLSLTNEFREAFEERVGELRDLSDETLAERVAGVTPEDVTVTARDERILLAGARDVWLSRAVATVETAAVETLTAFEVDPALRTPAAEPLRTFVRECPLCSGAVAETTMQNCCGGSGTTRRPPSFPVLACEECGTVVYELDAEV